MESVRLLTADVVSVDVDTLTSVGDESHSALPPRRARHRVMTPAGGRRLIAVLRGLPAEGDAHVEPGTDR